MVEKYSRLRSTYCYEVYNENGELATTGSTELICIKAVHLNPYAWIDIFLSGMRLIVKLTS